MSRFYRFTLEGRQDTISLPSVTTVLQALAKPALVNWAWSSALKGVASLEEIPEDRSQESLAEALAKAGLALRDTQEKAMGRGTTAHKTLEHLAAGQEPLDLEDPFTKGLMEWWEKAFPQIEASEQVVWSLRHGFAGTVDLITEDAVIDLKTRAATTAKGHKTKAYESDFLQVAAYRLAWQEMGRKTPSQTAVLVVRDDSTWDLYPGSADRDAEAFLKVLDVWRWLQERGDGYGFRLG